MKRIAVALLLIASVVWSQGVRIGTNPFGGSQSGDGFDFVVVDSDIGTSFELVVQDTGFTQMTVDTTLKVSYHGASAGDSAVVRLRGLRPNSGSFRDSLAYHTETVVVDSGDTVETDSTFHIFEDAWLDSTEAQPVTVFWRLGSGGTTRLDSIVAGTYVSPIAQRVFGNHDRPSIQRIHYTVYDAIDSVGARCEARVYPDLRSSLSYSSDYYVIDYVYVRPTGSEQVSVFGDDQTPGVGMILPAPSVLAVVCQGDKDNITVKVRMVGKRKRY